MKKIMLVLIFSLSIFLQGAVYSSPADPLIKFTEIAEEEKLPIASWEVSRKETINVKNPQTYVNKFRMYEFKGFTKDKSSIKYLFGDQTQDDVTVYYSIIIPKENKEQIELTAVIKGSKWNGNIKKNYTEWNKKMDKTLFSMNEKRFACLELIKGGTIGDSMIIEPYISSLELGVLDVQYDNMENSMLKKIYYGYTPLWREFFSVNGKDINLQIAVTALENGDLSYKIGTPILINEY